MYLTIGCIHEHLDRTPICGGCLLEVRAQIGIHNFWCIPCQEGQRPHRCEIRELDETAVSADNSYSVKVKEG